MSSVPADLGDAVAYLWRTWRPRWQPHDLEQWRSASSYAGELAPLVSRMIHDGVVPSDTADPAGEWESFILASAIDEVLLEQHPRYRDGSGPRALAYLTTRWRAHHRLDNGGIAPEYAVTWSGASTLHRDDVVNFFSSTRVVSAADFAQLDFVALRTHDRLDARSRTVATPLTVGCVPVFDAKEDLTFQFQPPRYFAVQPTHPGVTIDRAESVLLALDEANVDIGLCPESTIGPGTLQAWQSAIRASATRPSRLRWIVIGTGDTDGTDAPPHNRAVLLSRLTGDEITRQSKRHGFSLNAHRVAEWNLETHFAGATEEILEEYTTYGNSWSIVDDDAFTVAVAICEDLNRIDDAGAALRSFRPSLLLSPILDVEMTKNGWPAQAAGQWMNICGTITVVANSLVIARRRGTTSPATALVQNGQLPSHYDPDIYPGPPDLKASEHFGDVVRFEL